MENPAFELEWYREDVRLAKHASKLVVQVL